jgi:hypothetical protein
MTRRSLAFTALALALVLPVRVHAADRRGTHKDEGKTPWIHVEVTEHGQDGAKVKINVPISLARTALEVAPKDVMDEGHVKFDNADFTVADLRKIWKEVRAADDGEFVTVEDHGETVHVSKKAGTIYVNVDGKDNEKVKVQVPVTLVDALLTGDEETLNVDGAVAELQKMGPGEIVRVEDGEDLVRVWIE